MEGHDAAGPALLVQAWANVSRGVRQARPPVVPLHLVSVPWRFACDCGRTWTADGTAVVKEGRIAAPRVQCVGQAQTGEAGDDGCGRWSAGSSVNGPW